jgi:hypothetical protein
MVVTRPGADYVAPGKNRPIRSSYVGSNEELPMDRDENSHMSCPDKIPIASIPHIYICLVSTRSRFSRVQTLIFNGCLESETCPFSAVL